MNEHFENNRISKCISCNSTNFDYYNENRTLKLPMFICRNCKLYVTGKSQKEIDGILTHFYEEDFWKKDLDEILEPDFTDSYSIGRIRLWRSQQKYCKDILNKNKTILEIGCGHGEAICNFDESGYNIMGIEPDKKNVISINKKLKNGKCLTEKAETFSFDKKFDVIWLNHVFEHLSQPIEFLKRIQGFLKKSSFVFIEVPSVEKVNDYRKFLGAPHAYNYSRQSLINISKKANFEIIKCDYFRSPTLFEGGVNKLFNLFLKKDFFKFYPKILTNAKNGENIRIILRPNSM